MGGSFAYLGIRRPLSAFDGLCRPQTEAAEEKHMSKSAKKYTNKLSLCMKLLELHSPLAMTLVKTGGGNWGKKGGSRGQNTVRKNHPRPQVASAGHN